MVKFVVTQSRLYWWPIKVRVPNSDAKRAGQFEEFQFKAQFEAISTDEADKLIADVNALPPDERTGRQNDLLLRVVKGWDDQIIDESKEAIPFDPDTLSQLLTDPWVLVAFWRAWGESMSGEAGRKGN